jgi:hypothetical protein
LIEEWGDPRLGALDAVRERMRQIYDAKRAGTATVMDDVRLKDLHVQWMAVVRKFGDKGTDDYAARASVERMATPWRRAATPAASPNESPAGH